jgi:hypothetical protein
LSFAARAADLVGRIPPADKVGLLSTTSSGVPALGIGSFEWWSEGLHGIRCGHGCDCAANGSTAFPQTIGLAATFNRTLIRAVGDAISTEFRAFSNQGHGFLSIFAPNINIFREPRWGRGQVTQRHSCCKFCIVHPRPPPPPPPPPLPPPQSLLALFKPGCSTCCALHCHARRKLRAKTRT